MIRISTRLIVLAGVVLALCARGEAALQSEKLLPKTTKGYLSAPDYATFEKAWNETDVGQLMNDPVMQPFIEDFRAQMKKNSRQRLARLGLTWEDLRKAPSGEVAIAIIEPAAGRASLAVVAEVAGREKEAVALIERASANLLKQGAKAYRGNLAGVRVYILPLESGEKVGRRAVFYTKGNLLVAADNLSVLEGIVTASSGSRADSLASLEAFSKAMARCQAGAGGLAPHLRWFVEPFGYADAMKIMRPPVEKKRGKDFVEILRGQGFTAIQGMGGFVNFKTDRHEALHRTAIYAPPVVKGDERYKLAARMLDFLNGGEYYTAQPFVPAEVAAYTTFRWNVPKAFEAASTLVDAIANDPGLFEDVLDSLATAKTGPMVDLRKEMIANMKERVAVASDYRMPVDPQGERLLFAVEVINPEIVAAALEKSMGADEHVFKREFEGHVIWETVFDASTMPPVEVDCGEGEAVEHADCGCDDEDEEEEEEEEEQPPLLPHGAFTVAYGHLLVASHIDFLQEALTAYKSGPHLADSADYQKVINEMTQLGAKETSFRFFRRTDQAYRPTYELIRAGRLPEADSALARMLNEMLSEGDEGVIRKQKISGAKLPDYSVVEPHLGPAGSFVVSEDDGWFVTGFTLKKEAAPKQ